MSDRHKSSRKTSSDKIPDKSERKHKSSASSSKDKKEKKEKKESSKSSGIRRDSPASTSPPEEKKEINDKLPEIRVDGATKPDASRSQPPAAASSSRAPTAGPESSVSPRVQQPNPSHFKLDICAACQKTIMGDVSHAMNKKWHIYCFVCTSCGVPVSDEYYENDGKAYCRRDYNRLFGSTCAGCKKPLSGKKLKALDKEWHPQCFVCFKCKKQFPDMEYYDIDQQPYCETCYDEEEEKLLKTVDGE